MALIFLTWLRFANIIFKNIADEKVYILFLSHFSHSLGGDFDEMVYVVFLFHFSHSLGCSLQKSSLVQAIMWYETDSKLLPDPMMALIIPPIWRNKIVLIK